MIYVSVTALGIVVAICKLTALVFSNELNRMQSSNYFFPDSGYLSMFLTLLEWISSVPTRKELSHCWVGVSPILLLPHVEDPSKATSPSTYLDWRPAYLSCLLHPLTFGASNNRWEHIHWTKKNCLNVMPPEKTTRLRQSFPRMQSYGGYSWASAALQE